MVASPAWVPPNTSTFRPAWTAASRNVGVRRHCPEADEPTVRDALTAAALLARFAEPQAIDEASVVLAFAEYHEAAEVMAPEAFEGVRSPPCQHEVLRALAENWEEARRSVGERQRRVVAEGR